MFLESDSDLDFENRIINKNLYPNLNVSFNSDFIINLDFDLELYIIRIRSRIFIVVFK